MRINIIHCSGRSDRRSLFEKELLSEKIDSFRLWEGMITPSNPRIGIARSHKQIVHHAKESFLKEVLIAEDDFHFCDKGAFQHFLSGKPSDFDLYLGGIYYGEINSEGMVKDFAGLTFYVIRESFFDTFLNLPEGDNLDRQLNNLGNFSVCRPFAVVQHSGFSDNTKQFCDYNGYLSNYELYKADTY